MRIVLATDWWPPQVGGIESQVADLARLLAERGHRVFMLTATRNPQPCPGVTVHTIDWPIVNGATMPDPRRIAAISAWLEEVSPDVVHVHGMFSAVAVLTLLAASRMRIPCVSTVHSLLRPWPVFVAGSIVFRLFSNRADRLTAVSEETAHDVRRASGRDVVRVPNGVHLGDWAVTRRPVEGVRIAAVTRLVSKKAPADLISALAAARRRRTDVTLTIAGDGPGRQRLEREAVRLGVERHVDFLGSCSRAQVRDVLASASLLAHPGQHEAFGLALLEARAAGVPVAAVASGGVPDLVTHGRHGLLAPSRALFAETVAELAANDSLRAHCQAHVTEGLDQFDWPHVVEAHETGYVQVVEAGQARRGRG